MFLGVTTYVLTLHDLLLQQSAFSKYSGQISSGLKFSDFFSFGSGGRGIHDRANGFTKSFQPGIGRSQETLWPQTVLDLHIRI